MPASGMAYWTRERKRKWIRVLVLLLLFYVMLRWFEHSQVYFPDKQVAVSGASLARSWEDVYFKASDGTRLNGWFFTANTNSARAHRVVLLLHGNGGNLGHRLDHCAALLATGVNVFAIDYRGYGHSEGRPGEEGTYLDAQAGHQWLSQKGFAATNIIALGESLGG